MGKGNKILLGILAFVVVCVIGYALFSETITVTGTATANGNFDLTFECTDYGAGFLTDLGENIDAEAKCSVSGQTITTTSTLPKPSESTYFFITVKNNGTIPAVLKTIDSSNNYNYDKNASGDEIYYNPTYKLSGYYELGKTTNFDSNTPVRGDSALENAKITLEPQEELVVLIIHDWSSEYTGEGVTMPSDGVKMNYNITLGFEQITVQ